MSNVIAEISKNESILDQQTYSTHRQSLHYVLWSSSGMSETAEQSKTVYNTND